ncbi:MAG: hypothetical protein EAZ57_04485 [Cytophagales bacterium]|nr:MAG: hypothetical protein EAZ67_05505 [Cytophagales bacterium]TAF61253.1 MAG: hypothetical protein EAZ57_04485 [Cytophagales bacterium]
MVTWGLNYLASQKLNSICLKFTAPCTDSKRVLEGLYSYVFSNTLSYACLVKTVPATILLYYLNIFFNNTIQISYIIKSENNHFFQVFKV